MAVKTAEWYDIENFCNEVLQKLLEVFTPEEVLEVFNNTAVVINPKTLTISQYKGSDKELWQNVFKIIAVKKGWAWLMLVEAIARRLALADGALMPEVFASSLLILEKQTQQLTEENKQLKIVNECLQATLKEASTTLEKCPVTGLYNKSVLMNYLEKDVKACLQGLPNNALLLISIDNMAALNIKYGSQIGDEIIKALAYMLSEQLEPNHKVFRIGGAAFLYYMVNTNLKAAKAFAENLRMTVEKSTIAVEPITVSIGGALLNEVTYSDSMEMIFSEVQKRMQLAKKNGQNQVCFSKTAESKLAIKGKVLLADFEHSTIELLKGALLREQYEVLVAYDGERTCQLISQHLPDVVITELMLPKLDAFMVREKIRMLSLSKEIPFILVSHQKDVHSVMRAMALGIEHYLCKPFFLSEIVGIVNIKMKST